jgi:hypothetical protein
MRKSRTNRRTVKRQNRKQRGGKIVMPMRYFNDNFTGHYYANPSSNPEQVATSHGVPIAGKQMVGPDLRIAQPSNQQGGGVLPAEYFGGNSGRYFEEGAPELANCESAYGTIIPTSHGIVMGGDNSQWVGPNLAMFPNATKAQTGGCGGCLPRRRSIKRGGGGCGTGAMKKAVKKASKKASKKRGGGKGSGCGCVGGKSMKKKSKKQRGGYGTKPKKQLKKKNSKKRGGGKQKGKKGKGCGCRVTCKKC